MNQFVSQPSPSRVKLPTSLFVPQQEIRNQASEYPYKVAKLPVNRNLNRYRDVSPCESRDQSGCWWGKCVLLCRTSLICDCPMVSHLVSDDHSRVKLENSENDYINASLVMVEEAQRAYILSQVRCRTRNVNVNVCTSIHWINLWTIWSRMCRISRWCFVSFWS